jgi:cytidine deaminase
MNIDNLIELLIKKRLGLNKNINENASMLCGDSYHIACVLDTKKNKIKPLSYGINDVSLVNKSLHAEYDAIRNLPFRRKNLKNKSINLLVIRISRRKQIKQSKPCVHCIKYISKLNENTSYQINRIYYSDDNGEIIDSSLNELKENTTHISKFHRMKYT